MTKSLSVKIIIGIIICLTLGFLSGMATADSISNWYAFLNKPFFNPPNWIFAPVWTLLYAFMGIVFGRSWHKNGTTGLRLMAGQFLLNMLWSPIFFITHQTTLALVVIILLWIAIVLCLRHFQSRDSVSFYLLVPYLLWVTFATVLNAAIIHLN